MFYLPLLLRIKFVSLNAGYPLNRWNDRRLPWRNSSVCLTYFVQSVGIFLLNNFCISNQEHSILLKSFIVYFLSLLDYLLVVYENYFFLLCRPYEYLTTAQRVMDTISVDIYWILHRSHIFITISHLYCQPIIYHYSEVKQRSVGHTSEVKYWPVKILSFN